MQDTSTMKTGRRAQGQEVGAKSYVQRHGHKRGGSRRSYAAAEKALETQVRQGARRAIAEGLRS
ncbi:MAG: hypothetical protein EKK55_01810 [Rhodocyclaceae bacterium]|nr:MAG: hypothetical protein EKK55_01810 [Rhodocyclaceae bacterium]